jgi:hypothetical protein
MLQANVISNRTPKHGENRADGDRQIQNAGSISVLPVVRQQSRRSTSQKPTAGRLELPNFSSLQKVERKGFDM